MTDPNNLDATFERLTAKQREVLSLVSEGLTSKEIGRKLGISESAVNQRIETIRQRLGGLPRAQIGRIYRHQNTLLVTLPTSNSLTGKPIQLQLGESPAQASAPEGAVDFVGSRSEEAGGVLQPSTFSSVWNGPGAPWLRLGAIVGMAFALVALVVLALDAVDKLSGLLGQAR